MNTENTRSEQVQCESCEGTGQFCVGETLVSRDMAIDAECPSLEGMHYEYEFAPCPTCGGDGWIITSPLDNDAK
jgi:DnaJ-class molecular chaperone